MNELAKHHLPYTLLHDLYHIVHLFPPNILITLLPQVRKLRVGDVK